MKNYNCEGFQNLPTNDIELLYSLVKEVEKLNETSKTTEKTLLTHDCKISDVVNYIKSNLSYTLNSLFKSMYQSGEIQNILDSIFTSEHMDSLNILKEQAINVKEFNAVGDGVSDDSKAIQDAIDYASSRNKVVYLPSGTYLISKTINIKGCTLIGTPTNYLSRTGVIIKCKTKTFTAIKQDSVTDANSMFNLSNIIVRDALVGFEIIRAIHSKFENLIASSCEIGFKIGDGSYAGCEYTEFNHIITDNCRIGIEATSNRLFRHNKFTNSFINASTLCMQLQGLQNDLDGCYHNKFENVTFKSQYGRGIELYICRDVTFSNCLFECGGNAIRCMQYSTINLDNCCFKGFIKANVNSDLNIIYCVGSFNMNLYHGSVYVTSEHSDTYFFGTDTDSTHSNVTVSKPYVAHGGGSITFKDFAKPVKRVQIVEE